MAHGIRKGGLTAHHRHLPHLGSILGLTLLSGMQVSCPEDVRTAVLTTPPLVCHVVAWARERSLPSPHHLSTSGR